MGSAISVAATFVFVALVGGILTPTAQEPVRANPWRIDSVAANRQHGAVAEGSNGTTLEHALASPTPLHSFGTLPSLGTATPPVWTALPTGLPRPSQQNFGPTGSLNRALHRCGCALVYLSDSFLRLDAKFR